MEMERGFELFLCLLISKFELNIYGKDAEIVKGNDIKKKRLHSYWPASGYCWGWHNVLFTSVTVWLRMQIITGMRSRERDNHLLWVALEKYIVNYRIIRIVTDITFAICMFANATDW